MLCVVFLKQSIRLLLCCYNFVSSQLPTRSLTLASLVRSRAFRNLSFATLIFRP